MWTIIAKLAGALLLIACGYLYLVSGLVVPPPYLFALWALWGAIVAIVVIKRADWRVVLAAPFAAAALWFAILWAGGEFLGWRA